MGACFSVSSDKRKKGIVILGLEGAGKTTVLYCAKMGKYVDTLPTLGHTLEVLSIQGKDYDVVDVEGSSAMQQNWVHFAAEADAVVFVVDASWAANITSSKYALLRLFEKGGMYSKTPLLIFANKQDVETAISGENVLRDLELDIMNLEHCRIQECSTITGHGIKEGFEWLHKTLQA